MARPACSADSARAGRGAELLPEDVEPAHRLLLALQGARLDLFELEPPAQLRQRRLADDDLPGQGARAEARAGVRRVADGRVRERLRAADVADDPRPGMDAQADRQRRLAGRDALAVE